MVQIEETEESGSDSDDFERRKQRKDTPRSKARREAKVASMQEAAKLQDEVNQEMKNLSPRERLDRSAQYKTAGTDAFKKGDIFEATREYYKCFNFIKNLSLDPASWPDIRHTIVEWKEAKEICIAAYCNIALCHLKFIGPLDEKHPERKKALTEIVRITGEALRLNKEAPKALHRRALAKKELCKGKLKDEVMVLLGEARQDLLSAVEVEPQNKEIRAELTTVTQRLKVMKSEELRGEKTQFKFASTLSAFGAKERDLLGDGTIRKIINKDGKSEGWMNEEWLKHDSDTKCMVTIACNLLSFGGEDGKETQIQGGAPIPMSFYIGESEDIHDGFDLAVRSMNPGEVAQFTFAGSRTQATGSLVKRLSPIDEGAPSIWEFTFEKYQAWRDLDKNGKRLLKVVDEGWGVFAEDLTTVHCHVMITGPDGRKHYSTKQSDLGQMMEEDEQDPPQWVIGETCWPPLADLLKHVRTGGVGELRLKKMPPLPKDADDLDAAIVRSKAKGTQFAHGMRKRRNDDLNFCVIRAELAKVETPVTGPEDPRWEGIETIVQERTRAWELLEAGHDEKGLIRLRRAVAWSEMLRSEGESEGDEPIVEEAAALEQQALSKAAMGWVLVQRAQPILDAGNVKSSVLKKAQEELEEAKAQCDWLEAQFPSLPETLLLRAKILVAEDDDFEGAKALLLQAEREDPRNKRVQDELRAVRAQLNPEAAQAEAAAADGGEAPDETHKQLP